MKRAHPPPCAIQLTTCSGAHWMSSTLPFCSALREMSIVCWKHTKLNKNRVYRYCAEKWKRLWKLSLQK
jgi:hypothetical protein